MLPGQEFDLGYLMCCKPQQGLQWSTHRCSSGAAPLDICFRCVGIVLPRESAPLSKPAPFRLLSFSYTIEESFYMDCEDCERRKRRTLDLLVTQYSGVAAFRESVVVSKGPSRRRRRNSSCSECHPQGGQSDDVKDIRLCAVAHPGAAREAPLVPALIGTTEPGNTCQEAFMYASPMSTCTRATSCSARGLSQCILLNTSPRFSTGGWTMYPKGKHQ